MEDEPDILKFSDSKRKNNQLSTRIGKVVDKTSYIKLTLILLGVIFSSSFFYWLLSPYNQGTSIKNITYLNSLYFSVVTFSTVGYGDIHAVGIGKVFVVFEILSGVTLLSLLIGKLASERQSALLLLIYTSEQQRRLQEFVLGLDNMCGKIDNALSNHNHEEIHILSKQGSNYISSISNYLIFQSNQGRLASFGNISSLRLLYKAIYSIQNMAFEAIKLTNTDEKDISNFMRLSDKASYLAMKMKDFYIAEDYTLQLLGYIRNINFKLLKFKEKKDVGLAPIYSRNNITHELLEKVFKSLPTKPWVKNIHKDIAIQLKLTNSLAHKCINELVITRRV